MTDAADRTLPLPPPLPPSNPATASSEERLEAAARVLPRQRFFNDMPDKGLFGAAALVGFVGICGLKLNDFDADYIAGLAVAVMVGYGMIAYRMPLVQMRLDRLGDNFYYLGFIYTLASLSAALLQLRAGVQIEQLLGSFGIALVTTIVGIAGRVLFVQLRSELDDVEDRVRRDLAATSAELRAQLGSSIREFETFRTALVQTLTETQIECAKANKLQVEEVARLVKSVGEKIGGAFEANKTHSEQLNASVQVVSKSAKQAAERLAAMELPNERLNEDLGRFARGLEALLQHLGGVVEDVARRAVRRRRWYWPFGK